MFISEKYLQTALFNLKVEHDEIPIVLSQQTNTDIQNKLNWHQLIPDGMAVPNSCGQLGVELLYSVELPCLLCRKNSPLLNRLIHEST